MRIRRPAALACFSCRRGGLVLPLFLKLLFLVVHQDVPPRVVKLDFTLLVAEGGVPPDRVGCRIAQIFSYMFSLSREESRTGILAIALATSFVRRAASTEATESRLGKEVPTLNVGETGLQCVDTVIR